MRKNTILSLAILLFALLVVSAGCTKTQVTIPAANADTKEEPKPADTVKLADDTGADAAEMEKTCSDCHGIDQIKAAAYTSLDQWKGLVERMKTKGAPVTDVDKVAAFLEKSKGFKETGGGGAAAPAGGDGGGAAAPAGGASDADKAEVEKTCTDCHGKEQIAAATYSGVDAWKGLVERMKTKGAPVTDVDKVAGVLDATKGLK